MQVRLGSEALLAGGKLRGQRIGVVCNPSSVDHDFDHTADAAAARSGAVLGAIFGPQHGFRSDLQENMIETAHARDDLRRVPVYSLYSETREPTAAMLEGLDALGLTLDHRANDDARGREAEISPRGARVRAFVIPTNEEILIARDTLHLVSGRPPS